MHEGIVWITGDVRRYRNKWLLLLIISMDVTMAGQTDIEGKNWQVAGKFSHRRRSEHLFDVSHNSHVRQPAADQRPLHRVPAAPGDRSLASRVTSEWRHTARWAGRCSRKVGYREKGIRAQKNCRCTQVTVPDEAVINSGHCRWTQTVYLWFYTGWSSYFMPLPSHTTSKSCSRFGRN